MSRSSTGGPVSAGRGERAGARWRSLGLGATAIGAPTALSYFRPYFGLACTSGEVAMIVITFAAALFGTRTISERAFRLLRWIADRPEHASPPDAQSPVTTATEHQDLKP